MTRKELRKLRIAAGCCADCGGEPLVTLTMGKKCLAAQKRSQGKRRAITRADRIEKREKARKAGYCSFCFNRPAKSGRKRCSECIEKRKSYRKRKLQ